MLSEISYITRAIPMDENQPVEDYYYNDREDAIDHLNMLEDSIGELYSMVEVIRFNWLTRSETVDVSSLCF